MGTSTTPSSNSTTWTYTDVTYGSPNGLAVDGGRVFVIKQGGSIFYVLDETAGARVVGDISVGASGLQPGAAYSDGKLILTSSTSVHCFNATTGNIMWTFSTSPGQIQHPPTVSGNRVYVGTTNNYTYCIEDGVQKWYKKLGGPIYSAPAVDGDLLCIGCDDGKLHAFNIAGAQPVSLWNFTVGSAVRAPITIQGDKVYCTSSDSYLYVLDRTNGNLIWSWKAIGNYKLAIAVAYGIVYVGVRAEGQSTYPMYALYANVTAGNYTYGDPEPRLWSDTSVPYGYFGISVSGNMVFYSSTGNQVLYARNAFTGLHLWQFKLASGVTIPIVADGHVFVADQDGVYCVGASYPPVTNTYSLNVEGQPFAMAIQTNSTVSDVDTSDVATTMNMSFSVESSRGTGMCNITLPNSMLGGPYDITVGGQPPWSSATTPINGTHTSLYLTYNGTGKYTVEITGSTVIPEFTLLTTILSCGIITLTAISLRKRRLFT
jgi:outer membrane protein assembly factor BamB